MFQATASKKQEGGGYSGRIVATKEICRSITEAVTLLRTNVTELTRANTRLHVLEERCYTADVKVSIASIQYTVLFVSAFAYFLITNYIEVLLACDVFVTMNYVMYTYVKLITVSCSSSCILPELHLLPLQSG